MAKNAMMPTETFDRDTGCGNLADKVRAGQIEREHWPTK
jgi:hypothetical protein